MRVYVESFGCAQNLGEGAAITRSLHAAGHSIAVSPAAADAGVLVTCAVIGPTEARMVRRWSWLAEQLPRVVVTGCLVPLRADLLTGPALARTTIVPIRDQSRIPSLLGPPSAGPPAPLKDTVSSIPPPVIEEIPIAQGCTSACSYCFSRLARGRLESRSIPALVEAVQAALHRGAAEIRLSSLDTSAWGGDLEGSPTLPDLLDAVGGIPGSHKVRLGMLSPQTLEPIAGRTLQALERGRYFRFLHLPVQSGSDDVLGAMRRGYDVNTFRGLVRDARARLPDLTLATDIIVGFPTEGDRDFLASLDLVEEIEPEIVNVTRFSPRPMTPAARLPPLGPRIAKRRSRALAALRMRIARRHFERWIGRASNALTVERGPGPSTVARLPNYLAVVLPGALPLGSEIPVVIEGARSTYLVGRTEAAPSLRDVA
ncbi:MAG: tRNA (N(6)-L-threonylcarbamoyladenosine(37)-C(2))-methylthiotransferase [Thermoplasmata archaeon]|nr:tRNA (N(6)-L-threonylcarbamoyladenosine(37)-C(2))-methylthiotransferase [Thermoplasmata archaeon]